MSQKVLITTAIDYTNDVIHIGHAYQKILADCLARYHRQIGDETFFLTGTDEHGSKTEQAASERGVSPKQLADEISRKDQEQLDCLNISYDRFIRTTDSDHYAVVKNFYQKVYENGDIYEGRYEGIYCLGCESFLKEKDLSGGKCPNHPLLKPSVLIEENYFFRWKKYEDFLQKHLSEHPDFIQPSFRRNEMLGFLKQGLENLPISRPTVKFGVPVPNDPSHVLYVWFDALINYITGAPDFWQDQNAIIFHILGKDNLRWHALLWPAMLKSANFRLPNIIYGHDFLTLNGQKISKSLGNIIRPSELVAQFGTDAVRYFFLRFGPLEHDVDVTVNRIKEIYNADLANGLGNLVARVAKLTEESGLDFPIVQDLTFQSSLPSVELQQYQQFLDRFQVDRALEFISQKMGKLDKYLNQEKPWETIEKSKIKNQKSKIKETLCCAVEEIRRIAQLLVPFLPETSQKIQAQFTGPKIFSGPLLFPRLR